MEYTTEKELYLSLIPVFNIKRRLNSITKYQDIDNKSIWLYLKETKWKKSYNLSISEIVNDIITVEIEKVNYFIQGGK